MPLSDQSFIETFIAFFRTQLSPQLFQELSEGGAAEFSYVLYNSLRDSIPSLKVGRIERHSQHIFNQEEQQHHPMSHILLICEHHSYDLHGKDALEHWTQSWNVDTNWSHEFHLIETAYFPEEVLEHLRDEYLQVLEPLAKASLSKFLQEYVRT